MGGLRYHMRKDSKKGATTLEKPALGCCSSTLFCTGTEPLAVWLTLGDFLQFLTISKACLGVAPIGSPVPGSPVPWFSGLLVLWSSGPLVGGSLASQDLNNFISRMPT